MSAHPKLCFDLGKIFEEHGTEAVLAALRDACHVAADRVISAGDRAEHWQKAADAFEFAMGDVLQAEAAATGHAVDLEAALTVMSDFEECVVEAIQAATKS